MYKFLFVDITYEPSGPAQPFVLNAASVEEACTEAAKQNVGGRTFKVYQLPVDEGIAIFVRMYVSGHAVDAAPVAEAPRQKQPRA